MFTLCLRKINVKVFNIGNYIYLYEYVCSYNSIRMHTFCTQL